MVKIVAFARPLTHSSEDGITSVSLRDVIDELHDDNGLADSGATERPDFPTLRERTDEIDHLDAGL